MKFVSSLLLLANVGLSISQDPSVTAAPSLEKRYQKVRLPKTTTTSTSSEIPKPWLRTIYGTVKEIVTPTVIEGVTFNAKPPKETDQPHPWVSLDKLGYPKTIIPKVKNGRTENASPTYSTYFQTATTVLLNYEDLKAHNMDPDQVHEEVEFTDEDKTYVSLDPLIRCTPDRYYKVGITRHKESAPFCTPHDGKELRFGKTYFITWYSKFFSDDVEKVRLHFTYVKENVKDKGMKKREVESAFFSSDWIDNFHGFYPFNIQEEWLLGEFYQYVAVSIQPSDVADEDFDLLENSIPFRILKNAKVGKNTKEDRAKQDEGISDDSAYYVFMSIPLVVTVFGVFLYFFYWATKGETDFTTVTKKSWRSKHKVLGVFKPLKKNKKYSQLPQFDKENKVA